MSVDICIHLLQYHSQDNEHIYLLKIFHEFSKLKMRLEKDEHLRITFFCRRYE